MKKKMNLIGILLVSVIMAFLAASCDNRPSGVYSYTPPRDPDMDFDYATISFIFTDNDVVMTMTYEGEVMEVGSDTFRVEGDKVIFNNDGMSFTILDSRSLMMDDFTSAVFRK